MKKVTLILIALLFTVSVSGLLAQEKFGAKTYFDYTYNKDGKPTNEFEIHRVYFTYQNKLTDNISFKFTTDVGRFNTGKDDRMSVYLKYAQLSWKTDYGKLVFGLQGVNIFNLQEHNWGYRFVEKSPMDLYKWASSADLGIGYYNTFAKKIHVSLLATNGRGYKKSENDNYKKYSVQFFYGNAKIKKDGNFNVGTLISLERYDYTNATLTDTTTENKTVFGGFAIYQLNNLRIGGEYNIYSIGGAEITSNIISAYANYAISPKVDVFARIDLFDPNKDNDNDGRTYFIGGCNIKPGKGLFIAPNIRYTKPQKGDSVTLYKLNFQFKI